MFSPEVISSSQFVQKVVPRIDATMHTIDCVVFQWRLALHDEKSPVTILIRALQSAVMRGVRVRIIVNSETLRARLAGCGFDVKHIYQRKLLHVKMMVLDDRTAIVGSHNYTDSAMRHNLELSIAAYFPDKENGCSHFFRELWGV